MIQPLRDLPCAPDGEREPCGTVESDDEPEGDAEKEGLGGRLRVEGRGPAGALKSAEIDLALPEQRAEPRLPLIRFQGDTEIAWKGAPQVAAYDAGGYIEDRDGLQAERGIGMDEADRVIAGGREAPQVVMPTGLRPGPEQEAEDEETEPEEDGAVEGHGAEES